MAKIRDAGENKMDDRRPMDRHGQYRPPHNLSFAITLWPSAEPWPRTKLPFSPGARNSKHQSQTLATYEFEIGTTISVAQSGLLAQEVATRESWDDWLAEGAVGIEDFSALNFPV